MASYTKSKEQMAILSRLGLSERIDAHTVGEGSGREELFNCVVKDDRGKRVGNWLGSSKQDAFNTACRELSGIQKAPSLADTIRNRSVDAAVETAPAAPRPPRSKKTSTKKRSPADIAADAEAPETAPVTES